ncbi:Aste57867_1316 [Aphanomyces stellatus]|uniref:Aste57867_1316 protein n=1 Tax=Aphanomyces stellatus TaxID=120398 RepID=A0A485K513_9STRA|nr:hypothetical protein As57867_001315 [Aphanomyces stellatus]VFT78535.1 Aste57867_1316 [Aphanomyces stellatus]
MHLLDDVDPAIRPHCICHGANVHLKLSSVKLGDELFEIVMQTLRSHAFIKSLSLLHLGGGPKMAVGVADMLEHNSSLTSCDLSGNAIGSHGSKCLSMSLHHNMTLRRLSLHKCSLGTDGIADWAAFLQQGRNATLDTLDLSFNQIDDEGTALIASSLCNLKYKPSPTRRWHLNLLGNPITDAGIAILATMMTSTTIVATLDVVNAKSYEILQPERAVYIEHCARRNTRTVHHHDVVDAIRAIALSVRKAEVTRLLHVPLSEVDCVNLAHALAQCHATTHLVLRNNTLTLAGLGLLAQCLTTNKSLYSLSFVDNNVGGDGFLILLQALTQHATGSSLRELHIANSKAIRPETGQALWPQRRTAAIYQVFVQGCVLTSITLSNCALDDSNTAALVASFAWGCVLEQLDLSHNGFTDHVVPVFQRLLRRCRRMQSLDVGGNLCTLAGACPLVLSVTRHEAMQTLKLGRFAALDPHIATIASYVQANDRLVHLDVAAAHEHSRYVPVLQAMRAKLARNRTSMQEAGSGDASPSQDCDPQIEHRRQCRLLYVGREVARDSATSWLRPANLNYLVEQRFMGVDDFDANEAIEANTMSIEDLNVSHVLRQAVERMAMGNCDVNVLKAWEYIQMGLEDTRHAIF